LYENNEGLKFDVPYNVVGLNFIIVYYIIFSDNNYYYNQLYHHYYYLNHHNHHHHTHDHHHHHHQYECYFLGLQIAHKNQHPEDCSNAKYIISGGDLNAAILHQLIVLNDNY
jgi:ABC-type nickel/cobalt efflux system permease component RcnA